MSFQEQVKVTTLVKKGKQGQISKVLRSLLAVSEWQFTAVSLSSPAAPWLQVCSLSSRNKGRKESDATGAPDGASSALSSTKMLSKVPPCVLVSAGGRGAGEQLLNIQDNRAEGEDNMRDGCRVGAELEMSVGDQGRIG